jgi:hypothetical protein
MAMTETMWLTCIDPEPMLGSLRGKTSDRKLRLFAVACCRRSRHAIADEASVEAINIAEDFADGNANEWAMHHARLKIDRQDDTLVSAILTSMPRYDRPSILMRYNVVDWSQTGQLKEIDRICLSGSRFPPEAALAVARRAASGQKRGLLQQTALLRCVFGPVPFRPIILIGSWRTSNVTALAQSIYDDRAFDRLPILADALEDAGCDNADILNHCRQPGEHVRGCWVVDLVLRRE